MDSFFSKRQIPGITWMLILIIGSASSGTFAQEVEHNYPVGPSKTSCDSLSLEGFSFEESLEKIESTTFRFEQKFRNSRLSGVQAGQFLSCDGKSGFLLLTVDKRKTIHMDVPRTIWDNLIGSSDPDHLYREQIHDKFPAISE